MRCRPSTTGEQRAAFAGDPCDVDLVEMQMPVLDSLSALRASREPVRRLGAARTPIVMVTANATGDHRRRAPTPERTRL